MNMENTKLLEKVVNLCEKKENKEYQEKLKKVMPFIDKISKMKNELLTNEYSNKVLNKMIEEKIDFKFSHKEIDSFKFKFDYSILKEILRNNFDKSFINSHSIEDIRKMVSLLINIKKIIFDIYPIKEEMIIFFNILNLCYSNKIIDSETINSYLLTLNENLHFNEKYAKCYFSNSFSKNIYIEEPRNLNESFSHYNYNEFTKYIVISEENLQVIKKIEKQLEEKINKINSYYLGE